MDRHTERMERARASLEGLSVGDAFGDRHQTFAQIEYRMAPHEELRFTDDTQMALSVVEVLAQYGEIEQDALALSFGQRYDRTRAYGPAMHRLLPLLRTGASWQTAAHSLFGGQGSFGNGSAMRVASVGAYFADDLDAAILHAKRSAEVTHSHSEASAGAIAVAAAAAQAWQTCQQQPTPDGADFLDRLLPIVPESDVKAGIAIARDVSPASPIDTVVEVLGNGSEVSCQDTVPFCLWCATHHLDDYEEALWTTISALGDRDTTCAIVGGIVVMYTGIAGIPAAWRAAREPLPDWLP